MILHPIKYDVDVQKAIKKRGLQTEAQKFIDSEVMRLCEPYVPLDSGALKQSAATHTKIGSGRVVYNTPYARRWYYMPAKFKGAPTRGNFWLEKMKKQGGVEKLHKGIRAIIRRHE